MVPFFKNPLRKPKPAQETTPELPSEVRRPSNQEVQAELDKICAKYRPVIRKILQ